MTGDVLEDKARGITIRPLSSALGAEIIGVNLRQPLDEAAIRIVRKAWHDHLVIVVRNQSISVEDQRRFCSYFGDIGKRLTPLEQRRDAGALPEGVMYISNLKQDGKNVGYLPDGELQFHTDMCYVERPAAGASLNAIKIPSAGGDTMFSNLYKAYETLSDEVKKRLAGRNAVHYYDMVVQTRDKNALTDDLQHFAHPAVRTHPETKRKSLFVNRLMTARIEGLDPAESDRLLEMLFDHIEQPEFIYSHKWRVGDVLLWDNRCTAHARTYFDPSEERHLSRVVLQGDRPY